MMTKLVLLAAVQLAAIPGRAADFETAHRRSLTTGRPLLVLLGAEWCPGCQIMQKQVMPEVEKAGGLANVEFAYIDIDRNRRLAAKLSRAKTIPQLIRYYKTPAGWRYNVLKGAYDAEQVAAFIETGSIDPPPERTISRRNLNSRTTEPRAATSRKSQPGRFTAYMNVKKTLTNRKQEAR